MRVIEGRLYRRGELPPHLAEEYPRCRAALAELGRRCAAADAEDRAALAVELAVRSSGRRSSGAASGRSSVWPGW